MSGYSKTTGGFIIALFVAVAFTGVATGEPIGIHEECMDGINNDNDQNNLIDGFDYQCFIYPFADGGGESTTTTGPSGKAFSSDSGYEMSVFDYQMIYAPQNIGCSQDAAYQQIEIDSNGEDSSFSQYMEWSSINCVIG